MPVPWFPMAAAFVAALVACPIAATIAGALGWVDKPGVRKLHGRTVPYLGGGAVAGGLVLGIALAWKQSESLDLPSTPSPTLWAILIGSLMMFGIGLWDDTRDIRPRNKLAGQLIAAVLVVSSGLRIDEIQLGEHLLIDLGIFGPVVSVAWLVGVTNAVNIIDGLDGLAAGITVAASAVLGAAAIQIGQPEAGVVALMLAASVLGYLPYNVHPARIFLGDAGSLMIGFLLASLAIALPASAPTSGAFGVGLAALGIPILDTVFAMTRRSLEGRSIMSADRNHIHHRCVERGWSHRGTALALSGITLVGGLVCAATLRTNGGGLGLIPFVVLIGYAILFRAVGAIRLRDSYRAAISLASTARLAADERQRLDRFELELRAADNVDEWWRALGLVALGLGFNDLELELPRRVGSPLILKHGDTASSTLQPEVRLPVHDRRVGGVVVLRARSNSQVSLEEFGRRLAALSKILDRYSLSCVPSPSRQGSEGPYPVHRDKYLHPHKEESLLPGRRIDIA